MPIVMAAMRNIGGTLCSAPQFGWRPLLECHAVTLPRRKTCWNLQGWPKLTKQSQMLVGRSSPYYGDVEEILLPNKFFFQIVDTCLSCEDIAAQSCGMVLRLRLFGDFFSVLYFQRAARSTFQTCIVNLHYVQVWPLRLGEEKKERRTKKKPQDENIYGLPCYIGWP